MTTRTNHTTGRNRRILMATALPALTLATMVAGAGRVAAAPAHPVGPDYNGDGKCDLTVGAPGETFDNIDFAGGVHVMPGSATGPKLANQFFTQNTPGVPGVSEERDAFGKALAHGDFNGDGKDDLAVGVSHESVGDLYAAGHVSVLFGSATGLTGAGAQGFNEVSPGIPGDPAADDFFGGTLAAGDFNGDGKDDLAVSVTRSQASVFILWGSSSGLSTANLKTITGPAGLFSFGVGMAAADFNGDGKDDLALGSPEESVGSVPDAGRIRIYKGGSSFPSSPQIVDHSVLPGLAQAGANLGEFIAAGRVGTDDKADLVIGVPEYDVANKPDVGQVIVARGSSSGISTADAIAFDLSSANVPGDPNSSSYFGTGLAIGDFNGDGKNDVVVGGNGINVAGQSFAGAAVFFPGNGTTVTAAGSKWIDRTAYAGHTPNTQDNYGMHLSACDAKGNGVPSLVTGMEYQNVKGNDRAGSVLLLAGGSAFPATSGYGINESVAGVATDPMPFESFASTLG